MSTHNHDNNAEEFEPTSPEIAKMPREARAAELREICEDLVNDIVSSPTGLEMEWAERRNVLELLVTSSDRLILGSLIGKKGRTVDALKVIFTSLGSKYGFFTRITINERKWSVTNPVKTDDDPSTPQE